jgi:hypothetical protein|tara:strand:+ start:340 stop:750 length:411 start_codon:yes stop_codon:yes gene_type:complete
MESLTPENITMLKSFIWFLCGIMSHKFISALLQHGSGIIFMQEMNDSLLKLIGTLFEDFVFIKELKYKTLAESGADEEKITLVKEIDGRLLETWKRELINRFLNSYPRKYHKLLKFSDWQTAMAHLDEIYKNEKKG